MLKPTLEHGVLKSRVVFREALAGWFAENGRDYPWRRTREPYAVLVSEVMLQQTQIATVLGRGFYTRFLESFPDVETLATAADEPLLKAWEGLGYYRRARMLRETARAVILHHGGEFPSDLESLMKLPGVGRYTAGALRAFAFDAPAAVVDGNVARVLSRVMDFSAPVDDTAGQKQMWEWAEALADPQRPRIYNSALMELGQKICRPGVPDCLSCPVAGFCKTRSPEVLPVKRQKSTITAVDEHALWLTDKNGRLLLHRESAKRREGLWKLPTRPAAELSSLPVLAEHPYTITRYRVTLRVHDGTSLTGKFPTAPGEIWQEPADVLALAMPSPFRRVIERLLRET
ncbi:MAG: A/G-specific adenine glycosylase [Luteolibacter sp.]